MGRRLPSGAAAQYEYEHPRQGITFAVIRCESPDGPKKFGRIRPEGDGWVCAGPPKPILYRLPEVLAAPKDSFIFVPEGEKDVDRIRAEGGIATTTAGGAGKAHLTDLTPLRNHRLVLLSDNDSKGHAHVEQIAKSMCDAAASVHVLDLAQHWPDMPAKGDVSDWFDAGGTLEELVRLAEQTPEYEPTQDAPPKDEHDQVDGRRPKRSQATEAVALMQEATLFHTPGGYDAEGFATIKVNDHLETWPVNSKALRRWLSRSYYEAHGRAPGSQSLHDAVNVIAGKAICDGPEYEVHLRIAGRGAAIYIDLCDARWRVIEVTAQGWRVLESTDCPVRFVRKRGMMPLPEPEAGGSIDELRQFVNLPDDDDWRLVVAWLVAALRPKRPYPLLIVNGHQGSAKSSLCRMLRALVDPNVAPLRRPPKDERDLMIAAGNGHVLGYDNLSGIASYLSDALCCLATGGGFATRKLHTDDDEALFTAQRPVMLNGIDEIATRSDLLDRALSITLPAIPADRRVEESILNEQFDQARPRIFGALLDAVSAALANVDGVKLDRLPRMADFAKWVTAAEPALRWDDGAFMRSYSDNRQQSTEFAIEASPIGPAVVALMEARCRWSGTANELLGELETHYSDEAQRQRRGWPRSPSALGKAIRRLAPNLRQAGIDVQSPRPTGKSRQRVMVLEKDGKFPSAPSALSASGDEGATSGNAADGNGLDPIIHATKQCATRPPGNPPQSLTSSEASAADGADGEIPPESNVMEVPT